MSIVDADLPKFKHLTNQALSATTQYINQHNIQKNKFINFINTYKYHIIILSTIITLFYIIYNSLYSTRINRMINYMSRFTKNKRNLTNFKDPSNNNFDIFSGDLRLCDFYICSAYKCYLPLTNWFDYSSTEAIRQCIIYGARYLHLDIFPSSLSPDAEPIICNGNEIGNWHWTTKITLNDACKTIASTAFNNSLITNNTDPLFLHFSFKCWGNINVIDKCVPIIKKYFEEMLLSSEYSFNGKNQKINISLTPIRQLINKVIIITDSKDTNDVANSKMHELSNLNPDMTGNCSLMTYDTARDIYNKEELQNDNKRRMTIIHPNFYSRDKQNYNFYTPYYDGCQFLAMNFSNPDKFMINYMNKTFANYSFALKPKKLRYKPETIDKPLPQNPAVSAKPRPINTATYQGHI